MIWMVQATVMVTIRNTHTGGVSRVKCGAASLWDGALPWPVCRPSCLRENITELMNTNGRIHHMPGVHTASSRVMFFILNMMEAIMFALCMARQKAVMLLLSKHLMVIIPMMCHGAVIR